MPTCRLSFSALATAFLFAAPAGLVREGLAQDGRQQDEPAAALPAGPAIGYEDAFPGQDDFVQPLFVAFAPNDSEHAYVVTQPGQVLRVPRDGKRSERSVLLDLSEQVLTKNWEEGLLGFQFDPDYATNHHVWAYWSERIDSRREPMARGKRKSDRQSVVARYTVSMTDGQPSVDLATELRVLEVFQPFGNHNGGTIVFGPDNMLYIAFGDGGAAHDPYGNAESLRMLLGKVLRIDVRAATAAQPYKIPADNPFAEQDDARGEIWCYGLRNVWRMSFDRATGELWAADVGQDRIEEVNRLTRGGFYGWNSLEGDTTFARRRSKLPTPEGAIAPVATYEHRVGRSITGGHVYRGKGIPELQGWFVYSDFLTRRAWACRIAGDGDTSPASEVVQLAKTPSQPSSYAEEPDGELLLMVFTEKTGRVYRLVPSGD
ncbi:MAG: sorbosone dehydrogenase family protein [Planctomycetota bacterium]